MVAVHVVSKWIAACVREAAREWTRNRTSDEERLKEWTWPPMLEDTLKSLLVAKHIDGNYIYMEELCTILWYLSVSWANINGHDSSVARAFRLPSEGKKSFCDLQAR